MKKLVNLAASLIAGATLMMSASAAMARGDDGRVYERERPAYNHGQPHRASPRDHGHYKRYERHHYSRHDRHHYGRGLPARARYDRDRDGVPDRFDARPNNPRRY